VVSVGGEYNVLHYFAVYIMTHPQLLVEHLFKPDGDSGLLQLDVPLSSASQEGQRFAWSTNTSNGTGTAYPRPIFSSRYLDDSTVRLERQYKGQNFVAWIQAIDFTRFFPPPEETLEVWFVDEVGSPVLAPSLQMTPLSASLRSQVTSGILGTDAERIRVFVSKRNLEWSLSLAPADGAAALWQDRDLQYDINDPLDTGLDGADPDSVGGQLSVDFSGTTIDTNPECASAITSMGNQKRFFRRGHGFCFFGVIKSPARRARVPLGYQRHPIGTDHPTGAVYRSIFPRHGAYRHSDIVDPKSSCSLMTRDDIMKNKTQNLSGVIILLIL
jgi:hypothetical protein